MTDQPSPQPSAPLWTKQRIDSELRMIRVSETGRRNIHFYVYSDTVGLLRKMSDEYEAKLNDYQAVYLHYVELAEQTDARIIQLERELTEAKGDAEYWRKMYLNHGEEEQQR